MPREIGYEAAINMRKMKRVGSAAAVQFSVFGRRHRLSPLLRRQYYSSRRRAPVYCTRYDSNREWLFCWRLAVDLGPTLIVGSGPLGIDEEGAALKSK